MLNAFNSKLTLGFIGRSTGLRSRFVDRPSVQQCENRI